MWIRPKFCVLLLLVWLTGCAAYEIGNQGLYPDHVRTVYVPMIDSSSFRRNLGEQLTEAVVKEIELKTDYKVVGNSNADSILSARIVGETKRVLIQSRTGEPRELETHFQVEVRWIDRGGRVLRDAEPVPLPPEMIPVTGNGRLVPEVGHSVASSHQQAIHRLAEQIVSMMERPW